MATRADITFAEDVIDMMGGWERITAATRIQFPQATDEERYQIAKRTMAHILAVTEVTP
jgi:hypothetical protein